MSSMQPGPSAAPGGAPQQAEPVEQRTASSEEQSERPLADRPLSEHADVFQRLHAELQAALADIDSN